MATNQDTTTTSTPSGASDLTGELKSNLKFADTLAAQRMQSLQFVNQARTSRLSRELAALKAQKAPDSDIKAAQAAVDAATFTVGRAAMVNLQLANMQPEVAQAGWALHGRVFDSNLKPVSGFTVFLVDAQKSYQRAYGFAFTDDTGYFLINYSGPATSTKAGSKSTQPQSATPPTSQQNQPAPQLFLEIVDTSAQPVHLSDTSFQPVIGGATYQSVALAPGNRPIGDPPQEIRDIAMPPNRKQSSSRSSRRK